MAMHVLQSPPYSRRNYAPSTANWFPSVHRGHELYYGENGHGADGDVDTHVASDRLRIKQELQKMYEVAADSGACDLSLKDIVDPRYTISGNLKAIAMATSSTDTAASPEHYSDKATAQSRSSFKIFPFLLLRRSKSVHVNLTNRTKEKKSRKSQQPQSPQSPDTRNLFSAASSPDLNPKNTGFLSSMPPSPSWNESTVSGPISTNPMRFKYASQNASANCFSDQGIMASSKSKVHPSNQCSTCSSYTMFFKCRCVACGRLYCSNCAKQYTEDFSRGRKCKHDCRSQTPRKWLSEKFASSCLPICGNV